MINSKCRHCHGYSVCTTQQPALLMCINYTLARCIRQKVLQSTCAHTYSGLTTERRLSAWTNWSLIYMMHPDARAACFTRRSHHFFEASTTINSPIHLILNCSEDLAHALVASCTLICRSTSRWRNIEMATHCVSIQFLLC